MDVLLTLRCIDRLQWVNCLKLSVRGCEVVRPRPFVLGSSLTGQRQLSRVVKLVDITSVLWIVAVVWLETSHAVTGGNHVDIGLRPDHVVDIGQDFNICHEINEEIEFGGREGSGGVPSQEFLRVTAAEGYVMSGAKGERARIVLVHVLS